MANKKQEAPAPARRWIKLYCAESLRGSISLEPLDTQAIWFKLLLMAGDSRVDGVICATKGVPYPHKRIATTLGVRLPQLELCLRKFKEQDRITEDGDGIHINKWGAYQAPYQMRMWKEEAEAEPKPSKEPAQKPYREAKKERGEAPPDILEGVEPDPDKYITGKYGGLVARTPEDVERIRQERERRNK